MISKTKEKGEAIKLRKKGLSYGEIAKRVPVSIASLSLWLRGIRLAKSHRERLRKKKASGALKGSLAKHQIRLALTEKIKTEAKKELGDISDRELWLIGTALYWGEGSKQKENNPSTEARLTNSDPLMIRLYLRWLQRACRVDIEDIKFEIYIHETADAEKAKKYWSKTLSVPLEKLQKVRLKRNKIRTLRKNTGEDYHGLLRITVKRSTNFNRRITGWIEKICESCGIV